MSDVEDSSGPIVEEFRLQMNALATGLDELLNGNERPRRNGFILLMFPFGDGEALTDRVNYISNGNREDCISTMKELLANWEGRKLKQPKDIQ